MLKKIDKTLLFTTIFLIFFGILMIYSASSIWSEYKFNDSFHYVKLQSLFAIVGLVGTLLLFFGANANGSDNCKLYK